MLEKNGFQCVVSDGPLHLYHLKSDPSVVIFVFPHPCLVLSSYFDAEGSTSWDDRLQAAIATEVIAILLNQLFGRDGSDSSHSAIVAVFTMWFLMYCAHAHEYTAVALAKVNLVCASMRAQILDNSNLSYKKPSDSMDSFPLQRNRASDGSEIRKKMQCYLNAFSWYGTATALNRSVREAIMRDIRMVYRELNGRDATRYQERKFLSTIKNRLAGSESLISLISVLQWDTSTRSTAGTDRQPLFDQIEINPSATFFLVKTSVKPGSMGDPADPTDLFQEKYRDGLVFLQASPTVTNNLRIYAPGVRLVAVGYDARPVKSGRYPVPQVKSWGPASDVVQSSGIRRVYALYRFERIEVEDEPDNISDEDESDNISDEDEPDNMSD
jgi:hypothetical protein